MKQGWVVRAERGGRLYDAFKENAVIAIGWAGIGPLTELKTREKIAACVATTWPEWKPQAVAMSAGQLPELRPVGHRDAAAVATEAHLLAGVRDWTKPWSGGGQCRLASPLRSLRDQTK